MSTSSFSQDYVIEYKEQRKMKMPNTDNPFVLKKMKEIVEEKNNTVYLNKTYKKDNCFYSTIDSIYYDNNFVNDLGISTTNNKIEYYIISKTAYIKDQRYGELFELNEEKINLKLYDDVKTIDGYNCKKMTATYLKTEYELWVTDDIEYKGGPLVFSVLPYLVVEAKSEKRHFLLNTIINRKVSSVDCFLPNKRINPIADYEKRIGT